MSTLAKIRRLYEAVRPIPPQRHYWRILRRSQRKLYELKPDFWYKLVAARASRLESRADTAALQSLAKLRRQHELYSASNWCFNSQDAIELELHGVCRQISTKAPCDPVSPAVSYLWQMSSSYMGYLLAADEGDSQNQIDHFVTLCNGYSNRDAWQVSAVFNRQWHPYAASHRLLNLVCGRTLFDADLSTEQQAQLDAAIVFHTSFVESNLEYDIHFNHLAKNLLALVVSSVYRTGRIPVALLDEYRKVIDYQLLPDGGHAELCPMYHLQVMADIQLLSKLPTSIISGEALVWLESTVARMQSAAAIMSFSSGDIALFGDSWLGECPTAGQLGVPVGSDRVGTQKACVTRLEQTGYTKIQLKKLELILDNGHAGAPENPGHAHDDFLCVEIAVAGHRWVVDYGVESYESGQGRENTRSAQLHNGPTFEHEKGLDGWGSFRIGARSDAPHVTQRQLSNGWKVIDTVHKPLGKNGILLARSIAVNCEVGLAIYDRWTGVARSQKPRSSFLLTRDADFLTEHGLQMQVIQGSWNKQTDEHGFEVIGVPFTASKWVLEPETDSAMLLIAGESQDFGTLSSFLLQAITQ